MAFKASAPNFASRSRGRSTTAMSRMSGALFLLEAFHARDQTKLLELGLRWGLHQLPDRVKHDFKPGIVFLFQFFQLPCKILMRSQELAQMAKGSHDGNIGLNGAFAAENA